jgi:signal transduction histidine kinase
VEIGAAIEDVQKMLEAIRPQNVRFRREVDPALVARVDRAQLSQLLWNLCVNALQAMPHGGTLVVGASACQAPATQAPTGSSRRVDEGADALEICVRDTGVGMAAEVRERLFEPFFTTKQSGTGLGLATVHRIVESHGGELMVESEPGEGAVFRVRFPQPSDLEESA